MVTAWIQDSAMHFYPNTDVNGKYTVLPNGEFYINNAGPTDALKKYTCRTVNRLTGKVIFCLHFFLRLIKNVFDNNHCNKSIVSVVNVIHVVNKMNE